ncbi:MAG: DNA repair protein RadC [Syntrophales bacterium]|nr:DNA repair protein RadC [Syntrophales bacterium]MCK9527123.1 DNA repair protein RadC [Syntrophales bacterium]MDX9921752.1 DNA repair protein RadC [Syntrophales bacterium]
MPKQRGYSLSIRQWSKDDRPREKLLKYGEQTLSNAELMAIIIRTGTPGRSAVDIGREVLHRFRSLRAMSDADITEFREIAGLKNAKIAQIKAAVELGRRMHSEEKSVEQPVRNSSDVAERLMPLLRDLKKERFVVLLLDRKNVIADVIEIDQGTVDQANPHIREILQQAIRKNSASIIVSHNHPSGSVEPSDQDRLFTKNLVIAARATGICCFDHIIIGDNCYYSFADEGLMNAYAMVAKGDP